MVVCVQESIALQELHGFYFYCCDTIDPAFGVLLPIFMGHFGLQIVAFLYKGSCPDHYMQMHFTHTSKYSEEPFARCETHSECCLLQEVKAG